MSADYSATKYNVGDKVMVKTTSEVGRVTDIDIGTKNSDDKYFVCQGWHKANDLLFIK